MRTHPTRQPMIVPTIGINASTAIVILISNVYGSLKIDITMKNIMPIMIASTH